MWFYRYSIHEAWQILILTFNPLWLIIKFHFMKKITTTITLHIPHWLTLNFLCYESYSSETFLADFFNFWWLEDNRDHPFADNQQKIPMHGNCYNIWKVMAKAIFLIFFYFIMSCLEVKKGSKVNIRYCHALWVLYLWKNFRKYLRTFYKNTQTCPLFVYMMQAYI